MTEEHVTTSSIPAGPTAGALLRQYREQQGIAQEALAQLLRVAPSKLQALEADRWGDLPDAMFARALTLAVCRHLKVDAKPVLDLLPATDSSSLAKHDERGLGYAFDRPSFLPQSALVSVLHFFTPLRAAAVAVLALAVGLFIFTDAPQPEVNAAVEAVVLPVATPVDVASDTSAPAESMQPGHMVVTSVQSPAIAAAASAAAQAMSGASDGK